MLKLLLYTVLLCPFLCIPLSEIQAIDYHWKGGNGDFNDPNMWWLNSFNSGTTAFQSPQSSDNVYFDALAFTSGQDTITISSPVSCDSITFDNTIAPANAPRLEGNRGYSLDIYGSMELAENMNFAFNGNIRFLSKSLIVETIETRGHKLLIEELRFVGELGTEFRLLDALYIDDPDESNSNFANTGSMLIRGGKIILESGLFNTNSQDLRTDFLLSRSSQFVAGADIKRGLNISNSHIEMSGRSHPSGITWDIDFNFSTNNYNSFDATGSHIHFTQPLYRPGFRMGTRLTYDTLSTDFYVELYGTDDTLSIVNLKTGGVFQPHGTRLTIDTLNLGGDLMFFGLSNGLIVDHIEISPSCSYTTITRNTYGGFILKKNAGALNLSNVILIDVEADISNGSTYNAFNSIDIGNNINWNFTAPIPRDMFFVDSGDNLWHNPDNWWEWDGFTFTQASCVPSPSDNVFFDANSFPNPNQFVDIDSTAHCHNMRWLDNINPGDELRVNTNQDLNVFGTLELNNQMATVGRYGSNYIYLWGGEPGSPDSIISDGATIELRTMRLKRYANYRIADDLTAHNLSSEAETTIHTDNITIDLQGSFVPANRIMDSTYVRLHSTEYTAYANMGNSTATYTGNTTFHFMTSTYGRLGSSCIMPNVIMDVDKIWNYGTHDVQGDLTLNANIQFYSHPQFTSYVNVTGSMPLYNGDMNLAAGYEYIVDEKIYNSNTGGLEVAGAFNSVGNCTEPIILRTQTGQSTPFKVGSANVQYTLVSGMDNSGNPIITATNSVDNGGNLNWNFVPSGGTTFYWRADANDATDFEGNWDNPDHWTTNPADLTGTLAGCVPSVEDTVIFDNQSFSGTSNGCYITQNSFCKTLICLDDVLLDAANSFNDRLYIGESFHLAPNMTNYLFDGYLYFIGSGDINMNGTIIDNYRIVFNNPTGNWNLLDDLICGNLNNYGNIDLLGGTFNTNGHDLLINGLSSNNTINNRTLNLSNSTIDVKKIWTIYNSSTVTINPGTSTINLLPFTGGNDPHYYMGNDLDYYKVTFQDTLHNTMTVRDSANYHYAEFYNTSYILGSNSFDTMHLHGGTFTYLDDNTTQTLNPPYGAIFIDGDAGASNFVNIETNPSGGQSYFYKDYGQTFCVDWIKIRDNEGRKGNTPPPAWSTQHAFLQFETGSNSDNVLNTTTGIWAFDLPPILTVGNIHADSIDICTGGDTVLVPLQLKGTYPYSIVYTWTDDWGNSGTDTIIVMDDDNDINTIFNYNLALHPWTTTNYNIDVAALRCGGRNYNAPLSNLKLKLNKEELVQSNRTSSCILNNNAVWSHFLDNVDQKPILSILDSLDPGDNDSLGIVQSQVSFDANVQYWSGRPYLQRHWKVDADNNSAGAKVRLYFTQEELDSLTNYTFVASLNRSLDPATELILWKFDDTITVGTPTQIPFSVIPLTGTTADPFSNTTDLWAIEFGVNSFSGFMIQPTNNAQLELLLLEFNAEINPDHTVTLDWVVEDPEDLSYFEIERTQDIFNVETIATVQATETSGLNKYSYIDKNPLTNQSYYRLKIYEKDNKITYSPFRAINLKTWETLLMSPNPVSDRLTLEFTAPQDARANIRIYTSIGEELEFQTWELNSNVVNKLDLDLSHLPSGNYFLMFQTDDATVSKQFIIK